MRKAIEALPKDGWEWDEQSLHRNPYLQEVRRLASTHGITISGNDMEFDFHPGLDAATVIIDQGYNVLRKRYSYAIPTPESLEVAASCGPIVEIGSGKGYWSKMLSEMGVDVMPYDVCDPKHNTYTDGERPFIEVFIADAEIVAAHPDRTLFLCWPPLNDDMASRALSLYLKAGGSTMIYVGESAGGCTGDDAFFEIIDSSMVQRSIGRADVLRWWGIHDSMWVFDRRMG